MKRAASHYHGSAGARYSEYQRRIAKLGGGLNRVTERRLFSHFLKPVIHVKTTRLGSEYGAVHVPVQLLTDKSIVYSAGVGEDVTFDLGLIETVGCEVWAFDPTPRSIEFARSIREPRFHFLPLGVWSEDSVQRFHTPADSTQVSHSIANLQQTREYFDAECRSVRSLMTELGADLCEQPGRPILCAAVRVVDVSSLLTPDVHYVLDDHLTARGHELIAEALIAAIAR